MNYVLLVIHFFLTTYMYDFLFVYTGEVVVLFW